MDLSTANDILKGFVFFMRVVSKSTNKLYTHRMMKRFFPTIWKPMQTHKRHWLNSIPMNYCRRTLRGQHTPILLGQPVQ